MPDRVQELMVFPTELALRRYQQDRALAQGFVDASGHTTFARLRSVCLPYAKMKGRRMDAAKELLMRRQVVEVARGHFAGEGTLGGLSAPALSDVLVQLVKELSALPGEAARIVDWMLDRPRGQKLYQLGTLFSVWRAIIGQEGLADALDTNLAILRLLEGPREKWPPLLRDARSVVFRSVRWFNPVEEACVAALNQKMRIRVESALPPAHAEAAADRLGQRIRAEIMAEPWTGWAEDLGDAWAVDSPDVVGFDDASRIAFSRSAGVYGEIEDLVRRIGWHLGQGMAPQRIALVVPNIGTVQDIVPHVFGRFRIPYFFRRGRPVLSSPCVKAFFAWLAFPQRPLRDDLVDLVRNPAIHFEQREAMVERLIGQPPRLDPLDYAFLPPADGCSAVQALEILQERIVEPEDHFNAEAVKAVAATLEALGNQPMPLGELVDLLEELLENATIRPRESHDQGVWVLNPHDAAGLDFDLVVFAGLDEGGFPSIPRQDALLNDGERQWLRRHLEEQGRHLPRLALAGAAAQMAQEAVLFLSTMGMAREQLVLSCQAVDHEGGGREPGEFYRKLWLLAGWPAHDTVVPSPYDQWRIGQLGEGSLFALHLEAQRATPPEEREPMPGESFLAVVPPPLCRAQDEVLQAVAAGLGRAVPASGLACEVPGTVEHLVAVSRIESERAHVLGTPAGSRAGSAYCGHIAALEKQVVAWFEGKRELGPTALETLARCRYVFLVEQVFGLRAPRMADDAPDPMDRGILIHAILKEIYAAFAKGEAGMDVPRRWAVKGAAGWRLRAEGGADAVPLAVFDPALEGKYVAFARSVAARHMDAAALGHPGVWSAEREKVAEQVLNVVRRDARGCAEEGRYPALFELSFGGDAAVDFGFVRIRGKVDRVDLLFAETGVLAKIRVLDYKGGSRARGTREEYVEEVVRNLDCQLPAYAFAAQRAFFGEWNTPSANAMTEAGYCFYGRNYDEMAKKCAGSLLPLDAEGLVDGFLQTLEKNIRRLKEGDFAVDPLVASYTDYESLCRTAAVEMDELE